MCKSGVRAHVKRLAAGLGALGMMAASSQAVASLTADNYPNQPVTIIVANAAGSATDTLGRMVAKEFEQRWGQPAVVNNRPGGGGVIGVNAMKREANDGHTLMISFSAINSSGPWLYKDQSYHYFDDFTHISPMVRAPSLLVVNAEDSIKTLDDLIKSAESEPDQFTYGHGQATSQVMGSAFVNAIQATESLGIPYKGQPQALADLVGCQYRFIFADLSVAKPLVDAGRLHALGISSLTRSDIMEDVPTLDEQGIEGYDLAAWVGLSGPAGMDPGIADKINAAMTAMLTQPEMIETIRTLGFSPVTSTRQEFSDYVQAQYDEWGRHIKEAGLEGKF